MSSRLVVPSSVKGHLLECDGGRGGGLGGGFTDVEGDLVSWWVG